MTVKLDNTYERWHSIHTSRQKRYEKAIPSLIWATKMGSKTPIDHRLVYFARTFRTPRPLSKRVTFGFYDKKLPDPEEVSYQLICTEFSHLLNVLRQVDQLDPASVTDSEATSLRTREETPAQHNPRHLNSNSPTVSDLAGVASRKRKRPSEPPNSKSGPSHLPQPRPSQPPMNDQPSERLPQASQSSKRLIMDCVLITTLPPRLRRKPTPPETSGDEDGHSQTRDTIRGREKRRGKQREVASTSGASVRSDSRSLVDKSRSHSVSSIRRPLFEPVSAKSL